MTRRQRQPNSRVNIDQTAGPDTDNNLALDLVRAGNDPSAFAPLANDQFKELGSLAKTALARAGLVPTDSWRANHTLRKPPRRRNLPKAGPVGSTPRNALAATRSRNAGVVVPANGSHQLRGG